VTKFTPTETRIYNLLIDGECHRKSEIMQECFDDKLVSVANLFVHMSNLRKKMPTGLILDSVTLAGGVRGYRMSQKLRHPQVG